MENRESEQPATVIQPAFVRLPGSRLSLRPIVVAASVFITQPDLPRSQKTTGNRKSRQNQAVSIPDSPLPNPG